MSKQKKLSVIEKAIKIFKNGGVVIFPTDTVWGIGCSINQPKAIKKLYQIKKREPAKPTAVLVGSVKQAEKLGVINKQAKKLIQKYWPGGLTIIVKAKSTVPQLIQGNQGTVGLRMPNHQQLLTILCQLDNAVVASSANFSGQPVPNKKSAIDKKLVAQTDLIVDGQTGGNLASTVIAVNKKPFKLIRRGIIAPDKLPLDK